MSEVKILDPSDIHNQVNGLDIAECCKISEGMLFFVFPNLGYGFIAHMLMPEPVGSTTTAKFIDPKPIHSHEITEQKVPEGSGQKVIWIGQSYFVPLEGVDRSMFVSRCSINRVCEQESTLDEPFKLPIPIRVIPQGNPETIDAIKTHPSVKYRQFGLLHANLQLLDDPDLSADAAVGDLTEGAVASEILRSASSLYGNRKPSSTPITETDPDTGETQTLAPAEDATADPTKWSGNRDITGSERVEYAHLFDQLEESELFDVFAKSGFATEDTAFLRPSVLVMIRDSSTNTYKAFYNKELSDEILGQIKITGTSEAPMIEFDQTVRLIDRGEGGSWPTWSSNATLSDLPSLSGQVFAILRGQVMGTVEDFVMSGATPSLTGFYTHDYGTGTPQAASLSVTLVTQRPPFASAGEMFKYHGGTMVPFSGSYVLPVSTLSGIISDRDMINNLMYKHPESAAEIEPNVAKTIPYREGFTTLARAVGLFGDLLAAARNLKPGILAEVRSDEHLWTTLTPALSQDIECARLTLPPSAGDCNGQWVPWTVQESWESWLASSPDVDSPFLVVCPDDMGRAISQDVINIPDANELESSQSADHFTSLLDVLYSAESRTVPLSIDLTRTKRTITQQAAQTLKSNLGGDSVEATTGACLSILGGSPDPGKIEPMHYSNPITINESGTFSLSSLVGSFATYARGTRVSTLRKMLDQIPNIMANICKLYENTIIWVDADGSIMEPEPLWNCLDPKPSFLTSDMPEGADPLSTMKVLQVGFQVGTASETDLASLAGADAAAAQTLNASFNAAKQVFAQLDSGDITPNQYSNMCDGLISVLVEAHNRLELTSHSIYYGDVLGMTVPCIQTVEGGAEVVKLFTMFGSPMTYGFWFYNTRKLYMLWLSAISIALSIITEALHLAVSFKSGFYPKALIEGEQNEPLQKPFQVYGFRTAGNDPCYPIVKEDIDLTALSQQLSLNEIQDVFDAGTLTYTLTCDIPQKASIELQPVPFLGFGGPEDLDFEESQDHYWALHPFYEQDDIAAALEESSADEIFSPLIERFSASDFMALESGTLRYVGPDGDETMTAAPASYQNILEAIKAGNTTTLSSVLKRSVMGTIDFSSIFPYIDDRHISGSDDGIPIPVNFNSGMPWKIPDAIVPVAGASPAANFADTLMTYLTVTKTGPGNTTQMPDGTEPILMDAVNQLRMLLTSVSSDGLKLAINAEDISEIKMLIPFAGFADMADDGGALNAYVFQALGYPLKATYLDNGKVNVSAIAALIASSVWNSGSEVTGYRVADGLADPGRQNWSMNYNVFLSKRRAYLVAAWIIAKFIQMQTDSESGGSAKGFNIPGTTWYVRLATGSTLPAEGPKVKILRNVVCCYGFGSHFANAEFSGGDRDSNENRMQRRVYMGRCRASYGNPGVVSGSEQAINFKLPLGWELFEGLVPPEVYISANTSLTPTSVDGIWKTFQLYSNMSPENNKGKIYNKVNGGLATAWGYAAYVLVTGGALNTSSIGKTWETYREGDTGNPMRNEVAAAVLNGVNSFVRKSFEYGSSAAGAFRVTGTWLDQVHIILESD